MKEAIPKLPVGTAPKWFFMRAVWFALWGGRLPIKAKKGCKIEWENNAHYISVEQGGGEGGDFLWLPVCLNDGTKAYVKLKVYDTIYALNTGTVTAPTVNAGSVPNGSVVLE